MFYLDTSIHIVGHVLVVGCVEDFQIGGISDRASVHEILALVI